MSILEKPLFCIQFCSQTSQAEDYTFCNTCYYFQLLHYFSVLLCFNIKECKQQKAFRMVCLVPKGKGSGQSIYGKYRRGAIFQKDNHCNSILKVNFTFILFSSIQVSLNKSNIHITYQKFFVYIVEIGKFSSVFFKINLACHRVCYCVINLAEMVHSSVMADQIQEKGTTIRRIWGFHIIFGLHQ